MLDRDALQRRIKGRGKQAAERRAKRYLRWFDHIWRLQSFLLEDADRAGVPIVPNEDQEVVYRDIVRVIVGHLARESTARPKDVFGRRVRRVRALPSHGAHVARPAPRSRTG